MIYVDQLHKWPLAGKSAQVQRVFKDGSCHLISDNSLEELHEFAQRLGMKRSWFQQDPRSPHYDLNAARRAEAVALGAVECDRKGFVAALRRARARARAIQPDLPRFGLTLQNPWGHLILWGGKNVENRDEETALAIGGYRGRVLLTVSKSHRLPDDRTRPYRNAKGEVPLLVREDILASYKEVSSLARWSPHGPRKSVHNLTAFAGHTVGTAKVEGVVQPTKHSWSPGGHWHATGQYGIILSDPQPMEPRPCTGARRLWRVRECGCGWIFAAGARHRCEPGGRATDG